MGVGGVLGYGAARLVGKFAKYRGKYQDLFLMLGKLFS